MSNGNGVSRGDRNRNARLSRLRVLVPACNAIVGIDLADNKQMVVVTDHDSKVLARRTFRCRAWDLGPALDWAAERVARAGFAGVTVACEPTGHRWRVLGQLAADRAMAFVCVQTLVTSWARRSEDLTFDNVATSPNRWMRRGAGCATSVPEGSSCSLSRPSTSSRCVTCSNACGQHRWTQPNNRFVGQRGRRR